MTPAPYTPSDAPAAHRCATLKGVLLVTVLALGISQAAALPLFVQLGLSPLILGIVAGAFVGNVLKGRLPACYAQGIHFCARALLRVAVALFGLRISLQEIAHVGWPGLVISLLVISSTLAIGLWCGMKLLGLDRETALLTAAGSAICGAAAVLAFESALRSAPHKSAVAVGSVVLFGTASMFFYPFLIRAGWLQLDAQTAGLWLGGTLHEVAQVVGAASTLGPDASHVATIVKMTRVMLLVPVLLLVGLWISRTPKSGLASGKGRLTVPWFAFGFLALVAVNSLEVLPLSLREAVNGLDTFALTMAMTALGMETRFEQIRHAGPRVLAMGAILNVWLFGGGLAITLAVQRLLG
ncbi:YeiH family protein [Pseudomonas fulva]|uniref:YeiH family protein n=1 Tax=Pseudomonas fulva TaxID=47880 RepID=UPI0018A9E553|nr:YeiH family protein [Pseudomonas fulva]MBF8679385.1 YeiH family putative sulfate export transporter [Pseudomonas fulva]MBF8718019.1 YeiH family putative sulfate export transporter [Pseudomonas fulva]MBF8784148.1 YeiH family putative sulfate export transporter [Pseudomonas fulva]